MSAHLISDKTQLKRVCLLGASFDTGNLGVNALAESSIKCVLNSWPDAEVTIIGAGLADSEYELKLSGREIRIKKFPIRFSKNVFLANHFCVLFLHALLMKVFLWQRFYKRFAERNPYFEAIFKADMVADITGGDSFSDIYGMRRFVQAFLCKWLVIFSGKELVLFPQTYGPFKRKTAKILARYILRRADRVFSRDQESLEYVKNLLNGKMKDEKVKFTPDVAFILDARKPEDFDLSPLSQIPKDTTLVGLNISGLLFSGGYTKDNAFGLKADYRKLIPELIQMLLEDKSTVVLLIPHVFPRDFRVESDPDACQEVYKQFKQKYPDRIFLVEKEYDQGEIKYIIGLCDFFVGSRMHSCIAAMSQCIPAVGIAYSKKFHGVFESVGLAGCVADARTLENEQILKTVQSVFRQRDKTRMHLESTIPNVKKDILNII